MIDISWRGISDSATTAVRYVIIWILDQFKSVVELIDSLISSNQFYFFLAFNVLCCH